MRDSLEYLQRQLQNIDVGHTSDAIEEIRSVFFQMIELLDKELPLDDD